MDCGVQVAQGRTPSRVLPLFVTNAEVKLAMQFRTLHLDWQPTQRGRTKWIAKYETKLLAEDQTVARTVPLDMNETFFY